MRLIKVYWGPTELYSAGRRRAQQEAPRDRAMHNTERVRRLWALYEQLDELIEPDEIELYPVLEHLGDLIGDLEPED